MHTACMHTAHACTHYDIIIDIGIRTKGKKGMLSLCLTITAYINAIQMCPGRLLFHPALRAHH